MTDPATAAVGYRSPLLDLPDAVEADAPDSGVAAHYGSPFAEQKRLEAGQGFVDLSHRGVLKVTGPDRLGWLHSLTSQQLEGIAPHTTTMTLILSPQGHLEHAFTGYDDGESFWAHTEPERITDLVEWLDRMRFLLRVEVSDETAAHAVVQPADGPAVLVERSSLPAYAEEHGPPAGIWAAEALRIAGGVPRPGLDTDERTIPNEAGLLGLAVALEKGCYRGQETVARVHTLGRPPRRLVLLHLDGSVDRLPERGSDLTLDGRTVGMVGSSARHHELGPIGLGLVKRNVATDAELLADGVAAAQEVLVDPDVGMHVRPKLR
ncbi:MAG TPA: folate-binding protein [Nocardioidaceae bacterium]|nr:folate-binding protein [Nocardioidaceae bacterium]